MSQMSFFSSPASAVSVSELTRHVRALLEGDELLGDVWVQGEVSNFSRPKSGHIYFTLKDEQASLRCVMWRGMADKQSYLPQDGEAVEVHGGVSVYEAGGQYQLYADNIRPAGEGALYQEFLRLKEKLEAEGLFEPERKRPIPEWPGRIGIVTSPTGAALRDMLNTLRRRFPLGVVALAPASVQGEAAPGEIIAALERLNELVKPDVILLGRGGGSIEDLWAFNDEGVARAIAASEAPVIAGVGHETDFTIADFSADLRAPTPTAAAELATPDQSELREDLDRARLELIQWLHNVLSSYRRSVESAAGRLAMYSPLQRVRRDRQRVDEFIRRAEQAARHRTELLRSGLDGSVQRLGALSPQGVLGRGYAYVSQADGTTVRRTTQVTPGEALNVRVADGDFGVNVSGDKK